MMFSKEFAFDRNTILQLSGPLTGNQRTVSNKKVAIFYHRNEFNEGVLSELSNLCEHFENVNIYNWGHISYSQIQEFKSIFDKVNAEGYISVFIGGSEAEAISIWEDKSPSTFVSNRLPATSISKLAENIINIGYQRHFCDASTIRNIDTISPSSMSLGKIRSQGKAIEPIMRDVKRAYIDLNVLKSSEVPNTVDSFPTGLTTEELCQIMRYIGEANHLDTVFINTNVPEFRKLREESKVSALCIWYLLEGINHQLKDHPMDNHDFQSFIVDGKDTDFEFIKNNKTNRWWVKIGEKYLACDHQEYLETIDGNAPERFLH